MCGALEPRLDHGQVSGQELGHADHFRRRVNPEYSFGLGKGILQSAGRHADSATEIGDARFFVADHFGEFFRQYLAHVLAVVGGVINQLGGDWRNGGVECAEKARVAKDVDLYVIVSNNNIRRVRSQNRAGDIIISPTNNESLPDH